MLQDSGCIGFLLSSAAYGNLAGTLARIYGGLRSAPWLTNGEIGTVGWLGMLLLVRRWPSSKLKWRRRKASHFLKTRGCQRDKSRVAVASAPPPTHPSPRSLRRCRAWRREGRRRVQRRGDQKFADSLLEGGGFELPV